MAGSRKRSASPANSNDALRLRSRRLGARSCQSCHQRKVRCDRGVPCVNCSKHYITCVYPGLEPDTTRQAPSLRDISNRLERLEVLLSRFVEGKDTAAVGGRGHGRADSDLQIKIRPGANVNASSDKTPNKSTWQMLLNSSDIESLLPDESTHLGTNPTDHDILPTQQVSSGFPNRDPSPLAFYPDAQLALRLWDVYVKSVDPVVKILHIPTVQSAIVTTILNPRSAQPSMVALTFAIYYAALTALCYNHGSESVDLPCEKSVLLRHYQTALDRLLTTPDIMSRPEITDLQALAIYITCLRAHELGRRVWILTGLAIRLAQSIGLHRDSCALKLSPFKTEMRLRLWWHLCVLDSRTPEDQGFQPTVDLANQGLRLPLNVNDDQIYPDITQLPQESNSWTEMSFFLIQTKSCRVIHPILDPQQQCSTETLDDISEKRKMIRNPGQYLSAKYGISSESGIPHGLPRIAAQHVITACNKMEFVLNLREEKYLQRQNKGQNDAAPDISRLSFKLACDTLESSHVLLEQGLASRFKWLLNTYTQWYALAYVLRGLVNSPCGPEADRAWSLVQGIFPLETNDLTKIHENHGHGRIWKFLKLLRNQAWSLRESAQLSVANADKEAHLRRGEQHFTAQQVSDMTIPQTSSTVAASPGMFIFPERDQEFVNTDQEAPSLVDLLMPEIQFLPDWNAIINS